MAARGTGSVLIDDVTAYRSSGTHCGAPCKTGMDNDPKQTAKPTPSFSKK